MIPRYSRKEISKIWEPKNKYKIWLKIEILVCEAHHQLGNIPKSAINNIKNHYPALGLGSESSEMLSITTKNQLSRPWARVGEL